MERVLDIRIKIDGLVLHDGENVEDLISTISDVANTIYPITYETIQEEFYGVDD